jgi:hypothetical protein
MGVRTLVNRWLWLYTASVPPGPRDRRRDELASHLSEARSAGVTERRLVAEALHGALDDLRWCRDERERAGWAPILISPVGSTVIAGICMVATYLMSLDSLHLPKVVLVPQLAAVLLVVSFVDSRWRRRRVRPEVVDDPIFP